MVKFSVSLSAFLNKRLKALFSSGVWESGVDVFSVGRASETADAAVEVDLEDILEARVVIVEAESAVETGVDVEVGKEQAKAVVEAGVDVEAGKAQTEAVVEAGVDVEVGKAQANQL